MASSHRPSSRLSVLIALAVVGLSVWTGVSSAAPEPTAAETQQQIDEQKAQLETVTTEWEAAKTVLEQKRAEGDQANQQLGVIQARIETLTSEIGGIAAAAYKGDNLSSFGSFITSESPDEFIAKLNTLDAIGARNDETMVELGEAQQDVADLKETADKALAAAAESEQEVVAKKTAIETTLAELEAQLEKVSPGIVPDVDTSGYANGQIPASALCPVAGGPNLLQCQAASAYDQMAAAFLADLGEELCLGNSYRSYAQSMYASNPGMTAKPGTSNHGWGLAVDLCGGAASFGTTEYNWLKSNGGQYGWVHPNWAEPGNGREEPWHWEFGNIS